MVGIIYGYYLPLNDKWYVGQTINEKRRKAEHKSDALRNKFPNIHFHRAIRKYGYESFEYHVLETIEGSSRASIASKLNDCESYWVSTLDSLDNGYNLTSGGSQCIQADSVQQAKREKMLGRELSQETKDKMSKSAKGRIKSDAHRKAISETLTGRFNVKTSKPVNQFDLEGNFIKLFESAHEVERQLGISNSSVASVARGQRNTAGGYRWSYN